MHFYKYCFVILLQLAILHSAAAQTVKTTQAAMKINGKDRPAISITSEAEAKPLQKAWKKYLKKTYKIKTDDSKNMVTATAISLNAVSPRQFDLYTIFNITAEGSEMLIAGAPGYDIYFSPNEYAEDYNKLRTLAEGFVKTYMQTQYEKLIKEKKKAIAGSEKTERQLQKETRRLEKRVEKDRKEIRDLQKDIDKNTTAIDNNKKALPQLKKVIEEKRQLLKSIEEKRKDVNK